jgi:hypothetical protein
MELRSEERSLRLLSLSIIGRMNGEAIVGGDAAFTQLIHAKTKETGFLAKQVALARRMFDRSRMVHQRLCAADNKGDCEQEGLKG